MVGVTTVRGKYPATPYGAPGPVVESWARMVTKNDPDAVGVPEIVPAEKVRPDGNAPAMIE